MYEHLRNDFLLGLTPFFNIEEVNQIGFILDKVVKDYDISEKTTALSVVNNEIPRIVKLYIASKRLEGISEATEDLYGNSLRMFFEEIQKNPEDITTNDIRMYLVTYQMRRRISDRSLDKYRQIINGFFQWCLNEEYVSKNPCKNIKEIKYEVEPRHSLTRLQLEQVRRACGCSRDLAIIDVLYSTGCRVTELVNMKFSDINQDDNSITIIGKGRKHNIVYLNTNAQLSLAEYIKERKGDSEYIFVSLKAPHNRLTKRSVEHMCSVIANKLNIKLSPHVLRHTSATLALQSGMPITQVQKMLGHSSVSTTQIYAETSQEEVAVSHRKYVI